MQLHAFSIIGYWLFEVGLQVVYQTQIQLKKAAANIEMKQTRGQNCRESFRLHSIKKGGENDIQLQ